LTATSRSSAQRPPSGAARPTIVAALTAAALLTGLEVAVPAPASAQRYLLQFKPRVGDTLRMELEERREHTGTTRVGGSDSTRTMSTHLRMFSRAIVQGKLRNAVTVLAIIDSVSLVTTDQHGRATPAGQRMLFRLSEDGTMRVVDEETGANRGVSELVALMPAALPTSPVAVGDTWARSIPMVVARASEDEGVVRASFRLDSVSRDEDRAYISMRGEMRRDSVPAGPPRGTRMQVTGTVTGALLLDRRRGWLTESRFAVVLRTTMVPAVSSGASPVRFLTRITQRMRTLDRK
jgi:hypothetical protein